MFSATSDGLIDEITSVDNISGAKVLNELLDLLLVKELVDCSCVYVAPRLGARPVGKWQLLRDELLFPLCAFPFPTIDLLRHSLNLGVQQVHVGEQFHQLRWAIK